MSRVWNFSAGPAVLPEEVLRQAADEMLDWHGSGMGVMEMSHRGKEFTAIAAQAEADLRELLAVPAGYRVLFMQGGAIAENAIIPMNLMGDRRVADYVVTGSWSQKSQKEARKYAEVNIAASSEAGGFTTVPAMADWRLSADPAYVFTCTNETIGGLEYPFEPDLAQIGRGEVPVVADMSSHILSRVIDVSKYGLIFGGAQKNIGPAGLTIVIVREDLLGRAMPHCPTAFDFKTVADNGSVSVPVTTRWGVNFVDVTATDTDGRENSRTCAFLASDRLKGRETGTPEFDMTADYVAAQMKKIGLQPAGGKGSYFQPVPFMAARAKNPGAFTLRDASGQATPLTFGQDYLVRGGMHAEAHAELPHQPRRDSAAGRGWGWGHRQRLILLGGAAGAEPCAVLHDQGRGRQHDPMHGHRPRRARDPGQRGLPE